MSRAVCFPNVLVSTARVSTIKSVFPGGKLSQPFVALEEGRNNTLVFMLVVVGVVQVRIYTIILSPWDPGCVCGAVFEPIKPHDRLK